MEYESSDLHRKLGLTCAVDRLRSISLDQKERGEREWEIGNKVYSVLYDARFMKNEARNTLENVAWNSGSMPELF